MCILHISYFHIYFENVTGAIRHPVPPPRPVIESPKGRAFTPNPPDSVSAFSSNVVGIHRDKNVIINSFVRTCTLSENVRVSYFVPIYSPRPSNSFFFFSDEFITNSFGRRTLGIPKTSDGPERLRTEFD